MLRAPGDGHPKKSLPLGDAVEFLGQINNGSARRLFHDDIPNCAQRGRSLILITRIIARHFVQPIAAMDTSVWFSDQQRFEMAGHTIIPAANRAHFAYRLYFIHEGMPRLCERRAFRRYEKTESRSSIWCAQASCHEASS
jgi:hypothetical protein